MKNRIIFTLFIAVSAISANAQLYTPNGIIGGVSGNNNVGIGISNPVSKFSVGGPLGQYSSQIGNGWGDFSITNGTYGLAVGVADGGSGAGLVSLWTKGGNEHLLIGSAKYGNSLSINQGKVKVQHIGNYSPDFSDGWGDFSVTDGKYGLAIGVANGGTGAGQVYMWTKGGNQKLVIGNTTDGPIMELHNKNVAIHGKLEVEEIRVTLAPTADFVFEEDYNLRPLNEVEDFIKENKHLPEIASADEMVENGISLNEMNAKLLQKIEELTLYVIEQQKRIKKLEENEILFESIQLLDRRIKDLEK